MKFKEYLTEDKNFDSLLKKIKTECSSFVKDTTLPLYRGSYFKGNKDESIIYVPPRTDRQPKDSSNDKNFNNTFNLGIEYLFKIPLVRKKVIFISKNYSQARNYGSNVGFVFPTNGYQLIYGEYVYDSFEDFVDVSRDSNFKHNIDSLLEDYLRNHPYATVDNLQEYFKDKERDSTYDTPKQFLRNLGQYFDKEYKYKMESSISEAEKDFKKTTMGEIMVYNAGVYSVNIQDAAKNVNIKDKGEANYEKNVYAALVEKINAL